MLGSNIGTTITALLACIGQSRDAKRTAVAHTVFNVTGSVVFMFFIPWYAKIIEIISPKGIEVDVISRQIANAHTGFNVVNTIIWVPLIWLMVKIVMWILPDKETKETEDHVQFLDVNVINQPVVALHLVSKEIIYYATQMESFFGNIKDAMLEGGLELLDQADDTFCKIKQTHEYIYNYLISMFSSGAMNEEQSAHAMEIMYMVEDLERIGHCMGDLLEIAREKTMKNFRFSKKAMEEIEESFDVITAMYMESVHLVMYGDKDSVADIERYMKRIAKLEKNVRKNHKKRIKEGDCRPEFTNIFANIFHGMERIGENCNNIKDSVADNTYLRYLPEEDSRKIAATVTE